MDDTSSTTDPVELPPTPCSAPKVGSAVRNGAKQCKARSKRTGERCGAAAMIGREVCYHHGGKTPRGLASPNLKTGRRSKYLAPLLQVAYCESANSDQAKTLEDEIVQVDMRITELLGCLQTGERGTVWDDLQVLYADMQSGAALDEIQTRLGEIAAKGKQTTAAWRELGEWQDRKARLCAAEAKRAKDSMETVSESQMNFYRAAVVRAVILHVQDGRTAQEMRAGIGQELTAAARQIAEKR